MMKPSDTSKQSSTRSQKEAPTQTKKPIPPNPIPDQKIRNTFDKIIIHHTATKREPQYDVEWCRLLHKKKDWRDIGYHIYIEYDGTIQMGRPLEWVGAHTLHHNKFGIGIAYVGGYEDYDSDPVCTLTEEQKYSIAVCVKYLREMTGKDLKVLGHNDFKNTFCPGFDPKTINWEKLLDE